MCAYTEYIVCVLYFHLSKDLVWSTRTRTRAEMGEEEVNWGLNEALGGASRVREKPVCHILRLHILSFIKIRG